MWRSHPHHRGFLIRRSAVTLASIVVESAFSIEAMVRGYLIYRDFWTSVVNEELRCLACSSCVNFMYLPFFADYFDAVAVAASFTSRMVARVSFSDSGPLVLGRESNDFRQYR